MKTFSNGIKIANIRDVYAFEDGGYICLVDIDFGNGFETCEYVARDGDVLETGQWVYQQIIDGNIEGEIKPFVIPEPLPPTAEDNKAKAIYLLQQTDWTTIADVADPNLSNPYLMNQADFFAYRSQLRQIAINPVAGNIDFPVKPQEQWS